MMTMYEGDSVKLRRLDLADTEIMLKHWNDYQLRQYFPNPFPRTLGEIQDFISSRNDGFAGRYVFTFGIEDKSSGNLVGFIDLSNINWISRTGMIDNIVIFDGERGKGFGTDAMLILLNFAFNIIGLHNVYLFVYKFNRNAIAFYERIGFSTVGTLRESAFKDGERTDTVIMDLIKTDLAKESGLQN